MGTQESITIYYCGIQQCVPGHSFGPAVRTHNLLHFIFSGKGEYHENGRIHQLEAGEVFLIRPGESTYYKADTEDPWKYGWIGFGGRDEKKLLDECHFTDTYALSYQENLVEVESACIDMINNFKEHNRHPFLLISNLYRIFYYLSSTGRQPKPDSDNYYVEQAITYIENNYSYELKINSLAKFIGIERSYLYRLFMKRENLSPQQYLTLYRINASLKLLEETSLPVTQIAFSCGFNDASTYCRHFKRIIKITPSAYRDNLQNSIPVAYKQDPSD